jgi:hypothetical protein
LGKKYDIDARRVLMAKLAELFQAGRSETSLLVLFIPSADREGNPLGKKEQRRWVRKALKLLGTRLRGATAYPRGWGVWRDDAQDGRLVWDRPVVIQCFTSEKAVRDEHVALTEFLIELGTATNQGAVGFVMDRAYFEIGFPLKGD